MENSSEQRTEVPSRWPAVRPSERFLMLIQLILQFFVNYFNIFNRSGIDAGEEENQSGPKKKNKKKNRKRKKSDDDKTANGQNGVKTADTVHLTKFEPQTNGITRVPNGLIKPVVASLPSFKNGNNQDTKIEHLAEQLEAHGAVRKTGEPDLTQVLAADPPKKSKLTPGSEVGSGTTGPTSPISVLANDNEKNAAISHILARRSEPVRLVRGKARKTKVISLIYESNTSGTEMIEEMLGEMESEFRRCAEKGRHVICAEALWSISSSSRAPPGRRVTWNPNVQSSLSYPYRTTTVPQIQPAYTYTTSGTFQDNTTTVGDRKLEEKIRVAVGKQLVRGKWELTRRLGLPTAPYSQFHEDSNKNGGGPGARRRQTGFYRSYTPEFMQYAAEGALQDHDEYWSFRPGKEAIFSKVPPLSRAPFPDPYVRLALNLICVSF